MFFIDSPLHFNLDRWARRALRCLCWSVLIVVARFCPWIFQFLGYCFGGLFLLLRVLALVLLWRSEYEYVYQKCEGEGGITTKRFEECISKLKETKTRAALVRSGSELVQPLNKLFCVSWCLHTVHPLNLFRWTSWIYYYLNFKAKCRIKMLQLIPFESKFYRKDI